MQFRATLDDGDIGAEPPVNGPDRPILIFSWAPAVPAKATMAAPRLAAASHFFMLMDSIPLTF